MLTNPTARPPRPPTFPAHARRSHRGPRARARRCVRDGTGAQPDGQGPAPRAAGDVHPGGEAGVRVLRARVCGQGGGCEFLAARAFGLRKGRERRGEGNILWRVYLVDGSGQERGMAFGGESGRATRGCRGDVQTERTTAEYRVLFASRLYKSFDTQHKSI
jgi:hypothetical protein